MKVITHLSVLCSPQVSAEPDGSTYVFQGFIQGKDYGQFGLQRLGSCLLGSQAPKDRALSIFGSQH